ncbi:Maltase 2 [Papilio xuthus]|uniref:Maltase 2 n=1 Tax=Papilio xuthus TaxID=66420 RepID=A0A0N1IJ92_PAPXU|nr:Maltase 2 [Papilio xuthus]
MTEVYASPEITMRYYGDGVREGAQMPFNFNLITDVDGTSSAAEIKYALDKFLTFKPVDKLANWVVSVISKISNDKLEFGIVVWFYEKHRIRREIVGRKSNI